MTIEENLRAFMQDYHRAIADKNFAAVAEFLEFPFEITLKGGEVKLRDTADVVEAFSVIAKVHRARGVKKVRRRVHLVHATSLSEAIVSTDEEALDEKGQPIVTWRSSYLLLRQRGIWRIAEANAVNHDEVWEKVGATSLHAASASSLC
ncbi:nuclear transport factor 2 family protein [Cognatishimia maritima]|uniref:SnoaL-like domain-containing protein n=1 Tax=Cognatishimia maritima TaxID=870908 RepID=A0A1M5JP33_9RHOB|nr:nuclear transport factor 2 family protein [Cognatishimia maritima]SHG42040.1 hypothetical protein SAMN04488044_0728 [Cognatishimia maritima]